MSRLNEIADDVVALLGGITVSEYIADSVSVERVYVPIVELDELDNLKLLVMSADSIIEMSEGNRIARPEIHSVLVAIYAKVERTDGELDIVALDSLMDFRQEVMELLKSNRNINSWASLYAMPSTGAAYDVTVLENKDTFVSLVKLDYKLLM